MGGCHTLNPCKRVPKQRQSDQVNLSPVSLAKKLYAPKVLRRRHFAPTAPTLGRAGLVAAAFVATLVCALVSPIADAATRISTTVAYPGIDYEVWQQGGQRPTTIHVLRVDLSSAEITVIATPSADRGVTSTEYAAASGAQIVINGDLFDPAQFRPAGIARGDGITWEDSLDDGLSGFIAFVKTAQGTTATISPPADVVSELGVDVAAAVGGRPALVGQGTALDPECEDPPSLPCTAAPRTAVATSADGRTLFLVVVDGWQPGSYGLRSAELAVFLAADLGVRSALQLDSASASTMHVASLGGLVSSPSDGNERPVANHLAIFHGQLDPGSIQGGVFDTVVGGDKLLGATVTLDTGETTTYTGDTLWSFVVPPRYVCATGSADGFQDQTQCRQISSGENEFASMALLPNGVNQPDAGPGSAADGGPGGDGDAGVNPEDSGGCGCLAATVKPSDNPARDLPAVLACWGLLLVVFRSRSG